MVSMLLTILFSLLLASLIFASFVLPAFTGSKKRFSAQTSNKRSRLFTKFEVAKHNALSDCWIIVQDKVYDVTSYVDEHPGGYSILNNAGSDSTSGFFGPQHSSKVFDMIDEYYIGDLTL